MLLCGPELFVGAWVLLGVACENGGEWAIREDGSKLTCLSKKQAKKAVVKEYPACPPEGKPALPVELQPRKHRPNNV